MTRARMRSRLASEWEAMGWEWDLQIGGLILDRISEVGTVDPNALAAVLPSSYLARYGASREELASSIDRAIGGETLEVENSEQATIAVTVFGDSYTLNVGESARIEHSTFNVGRGTQINIDASADRNELLNALRALIISGLAGQWDEQAARAIGKAVEQQGVLSLDDVRDTVMETGREAGSDTGRIQSLMEKVAVGGLGSFLATGLASGLTDLLHLVG